MDAEQCNLCGHHEFADVKNRLRARCTQCGSLERTRLLWMYLQDMELGADATVLHLAPERGLHARLKTRVKPENYVCGDVDPKRYRRHFNDIVAIDLTDLDEQPSNAYDIILHSHVMEHVPCNIAYTLFHLHRMLKPGGRQVCVIPFMPGRYDECFQTLPEKESVRRFGQNDHVRRFGAEDLDRHLGAVVKLPEAFDAAQLFGEDRLQAANIPEYCWRGFTVHTVLILEKDDLKLR